MAIGFRYGKIACLQTFTESMDCDDFEKFYSTFSEDLESNGFELASPAYFLKYSENLKNSSEKPPSNIRVVWKKKNSESYIVLGTDSNEDRFDFDGYVACEDDEKAHENIEIIKSADKAVLDKARKNQSNEETLKKKFIKREETTYLQNSLKSITPFSTVPIVSNAVITYIIKVWSYFPNIINVGISLFNLFFSLVFIFICGYYGIKLALLELNIIEV